MTKTKDGKKKTEKRACAHDPDPNTQELRDESPYTIFAQCRNCGRWGSAFAAPATFEFNRRG